MGNFLACIFVVSLCTAMAFCGHGHLLAIQWLAEACGCEALSQPCVHYWGAGGVAVRKTGGRRTDEVRRATKGWVLIAEALSINLPSKTALPLFQALSINDSSKSWAL